MSLVPTVGRKSFTNRAFIAGVYTALSIMGVTMVTPFLITLTGSVTNDFDYDRFWPLPRSAWSRPDRFVKGLVYFFNGYRGWAEQMRASIPGMPEHWSGWSGIGRDLANVDSLAAPHLATTPDTLVHRAIIAADYAAFADTYPLADTVVTILNPQAVNFLEERYSAMAEQDDPALVRASHRARRTAALQRLSAAWGLPFESFYSVNFDTERNAPMTFQGWFPSLSNPKYQDFIHLKAAYRAQLFTPGVREDWLRHLKRNGYRDDRLKSVFPVPDDAPADLRKLWTDFKAHSCPASPCVPFALRTAWYEFLRSEETARLLGAPAGAAFTVVAYNAAAGTDYTRLEQTPFPVPASFGADIQRVWQQFMATAWPLRLTTVDVNAATRSAFQAYLRETIAHLRVANELLGTQHPDWTSFELPATAPEGDAQGERNLRNVWAGFVRQLPLQHRRVSSSEIAYQRFLLAKYGSLDAVNQAYGWRLTHIEEAFPPFLDAYAVTFANHELAFTLRPVLRNYRVIFEYLTMNANAVPVTLLLIVMSVLCTLTINPLAAYAMSRFNLRGQKLIMLYLLATMAFPAMVSAIPAYLLMRDLNLLNTFFALILPGAANGMAIFVLKGFFDSLPQELFEAATIDGASEARIFRIVAMPLIKPILAINSLGAFLAAYNGWEWALIVCQDQRMWTIAVWLYQANQWWRGMPWIVSAGFVVASIPTLLVFISCQKIILRGIIIPTMK